MIAIRLLILTLAGLAVVSCKPDDRESKQKRTRAAKQDTHEFLAKLFQKKGALYPPERLFIRVFKHENILEVWSRARSEQRYRLVQEYAICRFSGGPGPKRSEGDGQVPEGFYHIDRFNPGSRYYLSLGLNYPNKADRILGHPRTPGGDIFIHGDCVSIGCLAMTDEKIKEIYWLAYQAKKNGHRKIPVHIFPFRMDRLDETVALVQSHPELVDFWKTLRAGYTYFERHWILPRMSIDDSGTYTGPHNE